MTEHTLAVDQDIKRKTNWALLILIVFLPLGNIREQYIPNLGAGINFLNVFFILALIGMSKFDAKLAPQGTTNRWVTFFIIYSIFSMIVGILSVDISDHGHFNFMKNGLFAVALIFIVQKSIDTWDDLKRVLIATLIPLPYILYVVVNQYFSVRTWHYSHDLRISGTFMQLGANEMGAFFVTVALLLSAFLFSKVSNKYKLIAAGFSALAVTAIVLSYSRAAYVSLAIGMALLILKSNNAAKYIPIVIVVGMLATPFLPQSVKERATSISTSEETMDDSSSSRLEFWRIAMANFYQSPIIGIGYHRYHHVDVNPFQMDTHNYFVKTLVERGAIGFVLLLGVLFSLYRTANREFGQEGNPELTNCFCLGMIGILGGLVVGNMFGDRFSHFQMIAYFWVYAGLMLKAIDLTKTELAATQPDLENGEPIMENTVAEPEFKNKFLS